MKLKTTDNVLSGPEKEKNTNKQQTEKLFGFLFGTGGKHHWRVGDILFDEYTALLSHPSLNNANSTRDVLLTFETNALHVFFFFRSGHIYVGLIPFAG